jgi:hypothetical protein
MPDTWSLRLLPMRLQRRSNRNDSERSIVRVSVPKHQEVDQFELVSTNLHHEDRTIRSEHGAGELAGTDEDGAGFFRQ